MLSRSFLLLLILPPPLPVFAISQTPPPTRPSFEVASIKPNTSGLNQVSISNQPGGRFVANGITFRSLMTYAYRVRDFQISGGPSWISSDRWNIEARPEEESVSGKMGPRDPSVPNPILLRIQSLLEDRFQLKFHRETRELPVYELGIAKSGLKMKLSEDQSPIQFPKPGEATPPKRDPNSPAPRGSSRMMMRADKMELEANGIEFSAIVGLISQQVGRTIIDKTGLKGLYDLKLQWAPDMRQGSTPFGPMPAGVEQPQASDPSAASIFTALQEQLGLKVDPTKGPVEVLIIDSVQKPSEN